MKPGKSIDVREEIAEVHTAARSPSPKQKKARSRSQSGSRKLSNGHAEDPDLIESAPLEENTSDKSKRDSWIKSEHESVELPIHEQLKQGILGFVEKEIKKSDKNPSFVFYSHDPNGLDEKFLKTLSRPSSGHKEKRSPSYRKKKRHSSKHREREQQDFEIPGSSLSALEKVRFQRLSRLTKVKGHSSLDSACFLKGHWFNLANISAVGIYSILVFIFLGLTFSLDTVIYTSCGIYPQVIVSLSIY